MFISKIDGFEIKDHFSNCELSKASNEGRMIAVNEKYLAMIWKNNAEIVIVDSSKPLSIRDNLPRIKGLRHISDLEFSPFNNNIVSSCNVNKNNINSVHLWKIPENGLHENLTKELLDYKGHTKKVIFINFNPVVSELICSGAITAEIRVWNLTRGETYTELKAVDILSLLS